jgi:hypothetical protein
LQELVQWCYFFVLKLFVCDLSYNDGVLKGRFRSQLLGFKSLFLARLIEHHVLCQLAWVWQVNNISVWSDAKRPFVALAVVLQSATSNSDIEPLFEIIKLRVVNLAMPNFTAVVDHTYLADEIVYLEKLKNFAL